jgi:cytochrome c553
MVFMAHEPRPLAPREREAIIPDRTDPASATGTFVLADVTEGRNMEGVESGSQVRDLLILEALPKPINYFGGADIIATHPTYFLYRVLGTVPVAQDGSAYFEAPALRPLFFVARDGEGRGIKRMRSFTSVMPGEVMGCVGCHESRTQTPGLELDLTLTALNRPAAQIEEIPGAPEIFDFPRDIQPHFDQHCVSCHSETEHAGRLSFSDDRNNLYSMAYTNLFRRDILDERQPLVDIRSSWGNRPAYADGSYASPIVDYFDGGHHDVKASPATLRQLKVWIDAGAPYAGTYGALGTGMVSWQEPPVEILEGHCASCHGAKDGETDWKKVFPEYAFNLHRPRLSLLLRAPLSEAAGGYDWCSEDGPPVFADTQNPAFVALRDNLLEHARWAREDVRGYGFPEFKPSAGYFREMKRYGVIPADHDPETDPIRPYAWDAAYWRLFHYEPAADSPEADI